MSAVRLHDCDRAGPGPTSTESNDRSRVDPCPSRSNSMRRARRVRRTCRWFAQRVFRCLVARSRLLGGVRSYALAPGNSNSISHRELVQCLARSNRVLQPSGLTTAACPCIPRSIPVLHCDGLLWRFDLRLDCSFLHTVVTWNRVSASSCSHSRLRKSDRRRATS